jgi:hypothetical protein
MNRRNHAIAIYGTTRYKAKVQTTYKQRYWKKRSDGIRQRYRKTVTRTTSRYVKGGQRLTIYGSAQDVAAATRKVHNEGWIPKKMYEDKVSAKGFLLNPKAHARKGEWVDFDENET